MSKPREDKATESLGLSFEDRNEIVKSFVMAYLDSKVTVDLTSYGKRQDKEFLDALSNRLGTDVRQWSLSDLELGLKDYFGTRFMIATGNPAVTPEEKRKAINELFDLIVRLRIGDNMKGEFIGVATLESKLGDLEEKVTKLDESLAELRLYIRTFLGREGAGAGTGGGSPQ